MYLFFSTFKAFANLHFFVITLLTIACFPAGMCWMFMFVLYDIRIMQTNSKTMSLFFICQQRIENLIGILIPRIQRSKQLFLLIVSKLSNLNSYFNILYQLQQCLRRHLNLASNQSYYLLFAKSIPGRVLNQLFQKAGRKELQLILGTWQLRFTKSDFSKNCGAPSRTRMSPNFV